MTEMTISIDVGHVARELGLPAAKVQRTLELLDAGNTVPFVRRYCAEEIGGLDEEQICRIRAEITHQRQLVDRKQAILKSIESQGLLTPDLAEQIRVARSPKHLEDLYLPYKPKKQTLASVARQRGLQALATEILEGSPAAADLQARAAAFVSTENKLPSVEDVLTGVRHLIAETFSERADLRSRLRRVAQRTGKLATTRIEPEQRPTGAAAAPSASDPEAVPTATDSTGGPAEDSNAAPSGDATTPAHEHVPGADETMATATDSVVSHEDQQFDEIHAEQLDEQSDEELSDEELHEEALQDEALAEESLHGEHGPAEDTAGGDATTADAAAESSSAPATETAPDAASAADAAGDQTSGSAAAPAPAVVPSAKPASAGPLRLTARQQARAAARDAKKKKKQKLIESLYKVFYKFEEPLGKVAPHRLLAINRGERSHVLRVRLHADEGEATKEALELLVPAGHPHAEFLKGCVEEAVARIALPAIEKEIRREMTDKAEHHAVEVFVRNLRKLLLQPPVRGRRVLALDPGFRSGCKVAILDEHGRLLDHGTIHIVGPEQHRQLCRQRLIEMIRKHQVAVVAVGNGTACREAETLVADILGTELRGAGVAYVIVNEAGASVYATSPIGREELPKYDATVRSAVSIGRRLLDPLSELVKINPGSIGLGLYQHDLKAKHLKDLLDDGVQSCVNFVGVDVNVAGPALLRYVAGFDQLLARRVYDYRLQHGPIRSREQLKEIPGITPEIYQQAAGFLRVLGGTNPLDATLIHPDHYELARQVMARLGITEAELAAATAPPVPIAPPPSPPKFGGESLLAADPAPAPAPAPAAGESVGSEPVADPPADANATDADAAAAPEATPAEATTVGDASAAAPVEVQETATPAPEPPAMVDAPPDVAALPTDATEPETTAAPDPVEVLAAKCAQVDFAGLSRELAISIAAAQSIVDALANPKRDPREEFPPPVFRHGILRLEELAPGMELTGTVLNVVDFGVFVDIGLSDSALIHISRLADRFIRDPHEVVGVGDVLKVWVVEVDQQRRRVSLTAIKPGTERPRDVRPQRPERPERRPQRPPAQQRPAGRPPAASGPPPTGAPPAGGHQGGGNQGGGRRQQSRPPKFTRPPQKQRPAQPARPITQDMIEGKEPMRTFSDLLQFYQKKSDDGPEKKDKDKS